MTWMLKNSRGRPDALLTCLVVGVAVVLAKVLMNGMTFRSWAAGTIDAALAGAVLAPLLAAYTTKRVKVDADRPGGTP